MNETRNEKLGLTLIGACSLVASGAVRVGIAWLLICFCSVVVTPAFAQSTTAGVRLEAGIAKEEVDGDLKSAIDIYQKVAADASAPREVRAKALLRLAGCYEKLGRQAGQVYEQIVRDYGDQPAASQARTRLVALKQQEHPDAPTTLTVHKIELSGDMKNVGASDTDGRRIFYNSPDGDLYFGDLAGHQKRLMIKAGTGKPSEGGRPSRDFKMAWVGSGSPAILGVIGTDGAGYRELIRDDRKQTILGNKGFDASWSWDDRHLLVWARSAVHLWLVSVSNGQRREVVSLKDGYISKAVFSPDGRSIAYEVAPPEQGDTSRVFVMPLVGGGARQVYESVARDVHNRAFEFWTLCDWTADGTHLIIADALKGKTAIYLLPVHNGMPVGAPLFVRYAEVEQAYTTAGGALVYSSIRPGDQAKIFIASRGADGRLGKWQRLDTQGGSYMINPWPSFSADSSRVLYVAEDADYAGGASLVSHDLSNGSERTLYRAGHYLKCQSDVHSPIVFCTEPRGAGRTDLISIPLDSGDVRFIQSFHDPKGFVRTFPRSTGKALYLSMLDATGKGPVVRWDSTTHHETTVIESESMSEGFQEIELVDFGIPSADDCCVVGTNGKELYKKSISDGAWKLLVRASSGVCFASTPDGKFVIYKNGDGSHGESLFQVPIKGGEPQRIGDATEGPCNGLWVSPDGRRLLAVSLEWHEDLWLLENFIPSGK